MIEEKIAIGDRLIWEPEIPRAHERITVTAIKEGNQIEDTWIETENGRGVRHWNTESRIREACALSTKGAQNGSE